MAIFFVSLRLFIPKQLIVFVVAAVDTFVLVLVTLVARVEGGLMSTRRNKLPPRRRYLVMNMRPMRLVSHII